MTEIPPSKPTFEESYPEVNRIVQSRRGSWTYISLMEWADVSAILIEHTWKKWNKFDPAKGPLEHWLNRLISYRLINLRRDLLLRWSRPCIGGWNARGKTCVHNLGGDACEITSTNKQCEQCPIYADWKKGREHQLHLKSPVALDYHIQEVSSMPGDFHDYDGIKKKVDTLMRGELTQWEFKAYTLLYVQYLSPTATSQALEKLIKSWKRAPREEEQYEYQAVLSMQRRFKQMMVQVLRREGHIE